MNTLSTIRSSAYAWDFENRLASVTLPGSGGATTGYNVNNLDQYTSVGGTAYGYDADGNLTSKQSGGSWTYSYDDENRLTAVSGPTGRWTYQYDALGNRVAQSNGTTTTQYLVDPTGLDSVVAAFGGSSSPVNHFTYGLGLVSSVPASGSAQFYQFDGSANTVALTGAGGAVLNTYSYLPFGEKVQNAVTVPNPFTYAGQVGIGDDGDGLYYMRARYYDPAIGRFISEDPVRFDGGVNLYAYVKNNPIRYSDPLGLCAVDIIQRDNGKSIPNVPPEWGFCSKYRDGSGAGQILYKICKHTPDRPWANCVRGTLLRQFVPNDNPLDLVFRYGFVDHLSDGLTCAAQ